MGFIKCWVLGKMAGCWDAFAHLFKDVWFKKILSSIKSVALLRNPCFELKHFDILT